MLRPPLFLSLSFLLFSLSFPSFLSLSSVSRCFANGESTRCIVEDFQPFLAYLISSGVYVSSLPPPLLPSTNHHRRHRPCSRFSVPALRRTGWGPRAHTRPCTTHTSKRELSPAGSALPPVCVLARCTAVVRRRCYRGFSKSPRTSPRLRRSGNAPGRHPAAREIVGWKSKLRELTEDGEETGRRVETLLEKAEAIMLDVNVTARRDGCAFALNRMNETPSGIETLGFCFEGRGSWRGILWSEFLGWSRNYFSLLQSDLRFWSTFNGAIRFLASKTIKDQGII